MLDELLELELEEELLDDEELDDELLLELDEELLELDDEELLELELEEELLDDEELDDELLLELDEELLELDDEELLELELEEELLDEEELDEEKLLYPSSARPTRSAPAYVQAASCVIPAPNTPPASSRRNARRSSLWPTSEPEARFVVESCMLHSLQLLALLKIAVRLFQRQMKREIGFQQGG